jgi:uncharacterized membrane protein
MPTVLQQDEAVAAQLARARTLRTRRLLLVIIGLALAVLGLLAHRPIVSFLGLIVILLANAFWGGT